MTENLQRDEVLQTELRQEKRFHFHGTGAEYFRIWIVNILLTLATLGVYSAWAKVRRMKYFYENTELMGARFGYHANPKKVFVSRFLVILTVSIFYGLAFFFPVIEPLGSIIWVVALPALLAFALYFRMRNTSYRGLRFVFTGAIKQGYLTLWFPLAIAILGLAIITFASYLLKTDAKLGLIVGLSLLLVYILFPILVMPVFQVQWKRFAHEHSYFGNAKFGFTATVKQYIKAYVACLFAYAGFLIILGLCFALGLAGVLGMKHEAGVKDGFTRYLPFILIGVACFYALLFTVVPYIRALFFNLAWNNTQIASHKFRAALPAWGMVKLAAGNLIFILLTLGFFRPFAVIRTQRYLLEHLFLDLDASDTDVFKSLSQTNPRAYAEGALDLFGDMDM